MYTRYAYFMGQPKAGAEDQFMAGLEAATAQYAGLPGVRSARLEIPETIDDGAPAIFASIRMAFDSAADIEIALASPERQLVRAAFVSQVLPLFEGTVAHINSGGREFA